MESGQFPEPEPPEPPDPPSIPENLSIRQPPSSSLSFPSFSHLDLEFLRSSFFSSSSSDLLVSSPESIRGSYFAFVRILTAVCSPYGISFQFCLESITIKASSCISKNQKLHIWYKCSSKISSLGRLGSSPWRLVLSSFSIKKENRESHASGFEWHVSGFVSPRYTVLNKVIMIVVVFVGVSIVPFAGTFVVFVRYLTAVCRFRSNVALMVVDVMLVTLITLPIVLFASNLIAYVQCITAICTSQSKVTMKTMLCFVEASWMATALDYGWCFKDSKLQILLQYSSHRPQVASVLIAEEALALKADLIAAISSGFRSLVCFSGSLSLVTLLITKGVCNELKSLFYGICCLSDDFTTISFVFISRLAYCFADALAIYGLVMNYSSSTLGV